MENDINTKGAGFVKPPEILQYRQASEEEEKNYRLAADTDIKTLFSGSRDRFTIESKNLNEKIDFTIQAAILEKKRYKDHSFRYRGNPNTWYKMHNFLGQAKENPR